MMQIDVDHLRTWIGREDSASETVTPDLVRRFNATLGTDSFVEAGAIAPLLIHLCLGQPAAPMGQLGEDGHPARGGFLPPVPLPRRMWAGGAFTFHDNVRIGETLVRESRIQNVVVKQGRSGKLCFVTVGHRIANDNGLVITERQDIVYRAPDTEQGRAGRTSELAPVGDQTRTVTPTPTLLFRYSALMFNGHRIHYDRPYAHDVEGYPGLVVHGPMQATMLAHFAASVGGAPPTTFAFRSVSPLFDGADFTVNAAQDGSRLKLWTASAGGPVAMEATAQW